MKPPRSEMHPSKFHQSTGEPSSAVALGFTDIKDVGERDGNGPANTPSKSTGVPSSKFTFDLGSTAGLSISAQEMMAELQAKAAGYKAEIVAKRDAEGRESTDISNRRFAKPKGKSGRYSAAHTAEFEKMDSIENHASAWRANRGTPVTASLKRSPSKASLDDSPSKSGLAQSPSKTNLREQQIQAVAQTTPKRNLKRKSSAANLDSRPAAASPRKTFQAPSPIKEQAQPATDNAAAKRVKQRKDDDASSNRPTSAVESSVNRSARVPPSQSRLARLMSPTKASRQHSASPSKPTISMVHTPTKANATQGGGGLTKSSTASTFASTAEGLKRRILSPARIQKVKSILRSPGTAIPKPVNGGSLTPGPPRTEKELPPLPFTTPRKVAKRVTFTPETKRAAAAPLAEQSPTPMKRSFFGFKSLPGSASKSNVGSSGQGSSLITSGHVPYPDLSAYSDILAGGEGGGKTRVPSIPGTFTFRSDSTIKFGDASQDFGSSRGQSSIRQVRGSINPANGMPGSFPQPPPQSTHPDKENKEPELNLTKSLRGSLHGLSNKKRHRPNSDEEDAEREAEERASKKRKNNDGPERQALDASRSISSTPLSSPKKARLDRTPSRTPVRAGSRTPAGAPASANRASASGKRVGISMSRLDALARPKNRV